MPRTPDQSASSALRTTSVYHRSKSTDILVMSFTKSCCSSNVSLISPSSQSIHAQSHETSPRRRRGLERERGRAGRALGRDRVDLSQQHGKQIFLGHGLVKLTFLENHALAAPAGDADVGVAGFRPAVHDAAHYRDPDPGLPASDGRLDGPCPGPHVVLAAAA